MTIGARSDLVAQVLRLERLVLALGRFPADTTVWTAGDDEPQQVDIVRDLTGGFWQHYVHAGNTSPSKWRRVRRGRASWRSRAQVWRLPRWSWCQEAQPWFELLRLHGPVSDKEPLP